MDLKLMVVDDLFNFYFYGALGLFFDIKFRIFDAFGPRLRVRFRLEIG